MPITQLKLKAQTWTGINGVHKWAEIEAKILVFRAYMISIYV